MVFKEIGFNDLPAANHIAICRVSSLYQAARRPDIFIQNDFVTDIGASEVVYLDMRHRAGSDIRITLTGYGSAVTPGTTMTLRLNPVFVQPVLYYILSVRFDSISPSISGSTLSSNWEIAPVARPVFEQRCGSYGRRAYAPN